MPVPDNYIVEPNKGKKFFPIPEDKYQVMIYDVNPIREMNFKGTEEVDKLEFIFVVLDDKKTITTDDDGQPQEESTRGRRLWRKIPRSFSPGGRYKASLFYELMCAIEKKQLSGDDLVGIQPNTLIGQQLCVFVTINDQYNNIESFLKAEKDLPSLPTIGDKEIVETIDPAKTEIKVEKASNSNPSKPEDFIKGLEEDQKKDLAEEFK